MANEAPRLTATAATGDEAALVESACAGDVGAFGRLVSKYQDRVVNLCWRMCGQADDAEDIAQEALFKAFSAIGSFQRKSSFYTWLFRIAVNAAIAHRRRQARRPRLALHSGEGLIGDHQAAGLVAQIADRGSDPAARLSQRQMQERLEAAIGSLDDDHRAVVVLRDIEGCDYARIAEILSVPVGTVKSRLCRARMELRQMLSEEVSE